MSFQSSFFPAYCFLYPISTPDEKFKSLSVFREGPKIGAILFLSAETQGKIGIMQRQVKGLMSEDAVPRDAQNTKVLRSLKNLLSAHAKLQLFKAAILAHLTYCGTTWHFCRASDRPAKYNDYRREL